jgi:hypothetical protein
MTMAVSSSSMLRNITALSSILLLVISALTIYKTASAATLLRKLLQGGNYMWVNPLGLAGQERPEIHNVNLTFDWSSENFIWVSAGIGAISGLLGIIRVGFQEQERRRMLDGKVWCTSTQRRNPSANSFHQGF